MTGQGKKARVIGIDGRPKTGGRKRRPWLPPDLMEPFDDDDEEDAGRGIDPDIAAELAPLEMASLEDFPRIAAHLRAGGRLTSELREFLADRVLLDSLSRYLREGSELTPLARGILADACESWQRFMRSKRGQKPKRSTHYEQLLMVMEVAELMSGGGIGKTKACERLAKKHSKDDPSMEDTFRDAFSAPGAVRSRHGQRLHP